MQNKFLPLIGLFAAFAAGSFAQNVNFPTTTRVVSDLERPRVAVEKASGVKASVIVNTARLEQIAFSIINQKRAENGLSPLVWSDSVALIAREHSRNMAEFNFFSHKGIDNKMVSDRADDGGLLNWRSIGENIAFNRGFDDPIEKAVENWLESPTHKRNLLDASWQESAIGVAVAEDGSYYLTQVFLRK
ncbi:MAG: CAP domain-containing protein [Acidobacteriota bacterium]